MSLSASEFYEAGLSLPASVRKDVALRLLESVDVVDDGQLHEAWTVEISSRIDDVRSGKTRTIPHEEVLAHLAQRRDERRASRQQA